MSLIISRTGRAIDSIRINSLTREVRDGRGLWVKRRMPLGAVVLPVAQWFFRIANNPVRVLSGTGEWQRWEVGCFELLNGDAFHAFAEGGAVCEDELPGASLSAHLDAGTLAPALLAAAARELRRAHALHSAEFDGPWSHGDPHLGNFIHDAAADRARLIDFDVMHERALFTDDRHADDLLTVLLDMAGRVPQSLWLPCALAFLEGYARHEILERLRGWLRVPSGFERLWWAVRTTYMRTDELAARLAELRAHFPA
jgi:hypothetical protein